MTSQCVVDTIKLENKMHVWCNNYYFHAKWFFKDVKCSIYVGTSFESIGQSWDCRFYFLKIEFSFELAAERILFSAEYSVERIITIIIRKLLFEILTIPLFRRFSVFCYSKIYNSSVNKTTTGRWVIKRLFPTVRYWWIKTTACSSRFRNS